MVMPDNTLSPQWYRMDDRNEKKGKGEVMVSIWFGTQADEAFFEAWHSKATGVQGDGLGSMKSKVYLSSKLWYLRVSLIEAQDLVPGEKGAMVIGWFLELIAKVHVVNQVLRTQLATVSSNQSPSNPVWNEDVMFVVAEPFEDYLMVSVEDQLGPGRDKMLGRRWNKGSEVGIRGGSRKVEIRGGIEGGGIKRCLEGRCSQAGVSWIGGSLTCNLMGEYSQARVTTGSGSGALRQVVQRESVQQGANGRESRLMNFVHER